MRDTKKTTWKYFGVGAGSEHRKRIIKENPGYNAGVIFCPFPGVVGPLNGPFFIAWIFGPVPDLFYYRPV